jgi:hypothetical protein
VPPHTLNFCCEGCRGIYMMIHDIAEPTEATESAQNITTDSP